MHCKTTSVLILTVLIPMLSLFPAAHADSGQWVKYAGNPILTPTPGSWDGDYVTTPTVLYDGKIFRMWYQGGFSGVTSIGYATSNDGVKWVKHGAPVLTPGADGAWDDSAVSLGSVITNGTTFQMWYVGSNATTFAGGAVGVATSTDGINWVKYAGNPILTSSVSGYDQRYVARPNVIKLLLNYNMWYTGRNAATPKVNKILYATSFDGIHWTKWPTPVLLPATNFNAWDSYGVYGPAVIYTNQSFVLWYSGLNQNLVGPAIGFATAPEGATWTRASNNPILSPGPQGTWDSAGVEQPSVVQVGSTYMMYYDGYSSSQGQMIGLALSPESFTVPEFAAPTLDLFLGLAACAAIFLIYHRRLLKTF